MVKLFLVQIYENDVKEITSYYTTITRNKIYYLTLDQLQMRIKALLQTDNRKDKFYQLCNLM